MKLISIRLLVVWINFRLLFHDSTPHDHVCCLVSPEWGIQLHTVCVIWKNGFSNEPFCPSKDVTSRGHSDSARASLSCVYFMSWHDDIKTEWRNSSMVVTLHSKRSSSSSSLCYVMKCEETVKERKSSLVSLTRVSVPKDTIILWMEWNEGR